MAAVGGGVAGSLTFERQPLLLLPWLAWIPLVVLVPQRRAGWWGWLHGVVYWLCGLWWLVDTVVAFGGLPRPLAWVLLTLLALYLGLYHALFALLGRRLWQRGLLSSLLALPALWVAGEWARGWALGGFPWNLAAYAWVEVPGALPLAGWIGAFGVSYLVLFANVGLARAALTRRPTVALLAVLVPLLFLALAGRWAGVGPVEARVPRQVEILQPNISVDVADREAVWANYRKLIGFSQRACEGTPKLLLWPESAAWPFLWEHAPHLRQDIAQLNDRACTVVLNSAMAAEGGSYYNTALLVAPPDGAMARYDKRQLVPWGEHVPLKEILPFVGKLARQAGDFLPGREVALLPWGEEQIGMAICYEVIFPAAVAAQVRAGATVLATITNDAWYGDTAAPWQHFRAARFRAAENQRPMLRAALTGVSGLIDARGQVVAQLGVGEEGALAGQVFGRHALSLYSRTPWLVPWASLLLAAFAIVRPPRAARQPATVRDVDVEEPRS